MSQLELLDHLLRLEEGKEYDALQITDKIKGYYKNKPLKFIHTHFLDSRFGKFNRLFIEHFKKANMYKILLIIYRVIRNKWLLKLKIEYTTAILIQEKSICIMVNGVE